MCSVCESCQEGVNKHAVPPPSPAWMTSVTSETTAAVMQAVVRADAGDVDGAVSVVRGLISQSHAAGTFIARKLMFLDLNMRVGGLCREVVARPALCTEPGDRWFDLWSDARADEARARVEYVINKTCLWYPSPEALFVDLYDGIRAARGAVSWLWIELLSRLLQACPPEHRVLDTGPLLDGDTYVTACQAIARHQAAGGGGDWGGCEAVLSWLHKSSAAATTGMPIATPPDSQAQSPPRSKHHGTETTTVGRADTRQACQ